VDLILLTRKTVILDIRPNRDDNDHNLISTTDVDEQSARTFSLAVKKSGFVQSVIIRQLHCSSHRN
jgi:hypothetical protein